MSEQSQLGPSDEGTVVLDIGGDIGALILLTAADLLGAEIEISPLGDGAEDVFQHTHGPGAAHSHDHGEGDDHHHGDGVRTHVAVRERRGPTGTQYAAIYPGLREGDYQLWDVDGGPAEVVHIVGGEVAQVDWRRSS